MDPDLRRWIDLGRSKHFNWMFICWDAAERDWTVAYSRTWDKDPDKFTDGGYVSEIFRVDLRGTGDPDVSHVYLAEEP